MIVVVVDCCRCCILRVCHQFRIMQQCVCVCVRVCVCSARLAFLHDEVESSLCFVESHLSACVSGSCSLIDVIWEHHDRRRRVGCFVERVC